jgi:hypothetical protein
MMGYAKRKMVRCPWNSPPEQTHGGINNEHLSWVVPCEEEALLEINGLENPVKNESGGDRTGQGRRR